MSKFYGGIDDLTYQGFFASSAASTTTVTCAALADVAGQYVGQMVVPISGEMKGEGRMITAYNGTNQLTVEPAWAVDPDAVASFTFVIIPSEAYYLMAATKGLGAIYDLAIQIKAKTDTIGGAGGAIYPIIGGFHVVGTVGDE